MASVTLTNLSRPESTDFYSGERWVIEITGAAPNGTVTDTVLGNVTTYGQTDASGYFRMVGTMGREDVGIWTEIWKVNGVQILPTIQFRVRPNPTSPSENPVEIPEGLWLWGMSDPAIPTDIFVSDDETVKAAPMDLTLGTVAVEGWAAPWNAMSTAIGSALPARRRVYAY